jgi:Flp pilus assembly protein TadD
MHAAIAELNEAIRLKPDLARAYNARAYAFLRLRNYQSAMADCDQAIRIDPKYVNAYINRAAARRASGDKAGAEADLAKARQFSTQ